MLVHKVVAISRGVRTSVNGQPVTSQALHHEAEVQAGKTRLRSLVG